VVFPICLGYFIYYISAQTAQTSAAILVKNYLPDGLWAWSFISVILILWDRRINFTWVLATYLLSAGFELLQLLDILPGTADLVDLIVYFTFMGIALYTNSFFRKKFPVKAT
jgi:hypothetical protein